MADRLNIRLAVAAAIASGALAFIAYQWFTRPAPALRASSQIAPLPTPRERVTPEHASDLAERVVIKAAKQWRDNDITPELVQALQIDAQVTLVSLMNDDFEEYRELMASKNAVLGERAAGLAEHFRDFGYKDVPGPQWDTMSVEERYEYMWTHSDARRAGWERIDSKRTIAGSGWYLTVEESAKSVTGVYTAFQFPGFDAIMVRAERGEIPVAWMQFPVQFTGRPTTEIRVTFVYSPEGEQWYPLRVETLGRMSKPPLLF